MQTGGRQRHAVTVSWPRIINLSLIETLWHGDSALIYSRLNVIGQSYM